jgi:hypothetical protein
MSIYCRSGLESQIFKYTTHEIRALQTQLVKVNEAAIIYTNSLNETFKTGEKPWIENGPYKVDRDSVVCKATRYGLGEPGFEHCWGEVFPTLPDRL